MSDHDSDWSPTPATQEPPKLVDIAPDDPAVRVLTLPPPLAPIDDEETPPPFDPGAPPPEVLARKERQRPIANAELLRAFVGQHPDEDDVPSLRLRILKLEQDLANLTKFVRDEYKRRTSG